MNKAIQPEGEEQLAPREREAQREIQRAFLAARDDQERHRRPYPKEQDGYLQIMALDSQRGTESAERPGWEQQYRQVVGGILGNAAADEMLAGNPKVLTMLNHARAANLSVVLPRVK